MADIISGEFFKTGGFFKGYRKRFYKLEWHGQKLYYGKDEDTIESFNLWEVYDASFKLARLVEVDDHQLIDYKSNFSSSSEEEEIAGVITLTFLGLKSLFRGNLTRMFAIPDEEEFHSLCYWLMAQH